LRDRQQRVGLEAIPPGVLDRVDAIIALHGPGRSDPACREPNELFENQDHDQARILRLLVERIDVALDGISVTLRSAGIRSLVAELASEETAALDPRDERMLEPAE
jgi:hypothetical protein